MLNLLKNRKATRVCVFDIFVLYIALVSCVSILLLAFEGFSGSRALIVGGILLLCAYKVFSFRVNLRDSRFDVWILMILLGALFFRVNPSLYLAGGQDEGLYISMSRQYEMEGSVRIKDRLREQLTGGETSIYDESIGLPSVVVLDKQDSTYVVAFYPLHPCWLAIFNNLFGEGNSVYSLTLFSILSIIAFYLLGYEISGGKKSVGYLVALFLAVNPLHAFLSKFPVTEMLALSLASLGFYYLIKYYKEAKEDKNSSPFFIILSLVLFNAFLYSRMSALMYVSFFYVIALLVAIFVQNRVVRKNLLIFISSLAGCYVFMGLFYYKYINILFVSYYSYFTSIFGSNLWIKVLLFAILGVGLVFSAYRFRKRLRRLLKKIESFNLAFALVGLVLLIAVGFYNFYQLSFTDKWVGSRYQTLWRMTGLGWRAVKYLPIYTMMLYLSPVGILLYPAAAFVLGRLKSVYLSLTMFFLTIFLFYTAFIVKFTSYHYYYARYFMTETIPYTFLLVSVFLVYIRRTMVLKAISSLSIFTIIVYSVFFTAFQLQGNEGAEEGFFNEFSNYVNKDDLLFVDLEAFGLRNEVLTPLKYYYNFTTFHIPNSDYIYNTDIQGLYSRFDDAYLLSMHRLEDNRDIEYLKSFKYKQSFFSSCKSRHLYSFIPSERDVQDSRFPYCSAMVPSTYNTGVITLYLYKILGDIDTR